LIDSLRPVVQAVHTFSSILGEAASFVGSTHSILLVGSYLYPSLQVPFTSLWTHDAQTDSWAAYASEKASLLSALHTVPNVYFLSGDQHEFAAIEFNPLSEVGAGAHVVRELSTSPLSMF